MRSKTLGTGVLTAVSTILILSACRSRDPYTNDWAKTTLDSLLWSEPDVRLWLGDVRFVNSSMLGRTLEPGEASLADEGLYAAYARKGFIEFHVGPDLADRFTGWDDWFQLTQGGVRKRARVSATTDGLGAGKVTTVSGVDALEIRSSTGSVTAIVSNDSVSLSGSRYRLIMGTLIWDYPPDLREVFRDRGDTIGSSRRFRVLLKHDPFINQWKLVAADVGSFTGGFLSRNVDAVISSGGV